MDLISCPEFVFCVNSALGHKINILLADVGGKALCGGRIVTQATTGGFFCPLLRVTVSAKYDPLMLCKCPANKFLQCGFKIRCLLQFVCKLAQFLSHDGVQNDVRSGDRLGRTQHTELEFVTGKGQGRGAIAVCGVLGDGWQNVYADSHNTFFRVGVVCAVDNGIHNCAQFIT